MCYSITRYEINALPERSHCVKFKKESQQLQNMPYGVYKTPILETYFYHQKFFAMELKTIQSRIYEIRGQRIMFDFDLAELYETETKRFKESVRRNLDRFPSDFMFETYSRRIRKFEDANSDLKKRR